MHGHRTVPPLALALLAATMLTPPEAARAAPADALGPEFQVNAVTAGDQFRPAVAMDADGDFVVAWEGVDPSYYPDIFPDIFARRFDAAGVPKGVEFQVNTTTTNFQLLPAVAMHADGDFVVAWSDFGGQAGDSWGVFAQRFDAAGVVQGPEFQVNTFTTGPQLLPAVAMDADGDFVVAWHSLGQDGDDYGIFTRRYDTTGTAQGPEIQVNSSSTGSQRDPAVAMDADGDFVVAWVDEHGLDGSGRGVFARRFDAAGAAAGPEFQVNTFASGDQLGPAVAMDADGDFVVAWWGNGSGDGYGVFARRFDAVGAPLGPEFQVNGFATGRQLIPAVAMDADGDFVVAWEDEAGQDGDGRGVFARRFDAAGAPRGPEFQVNSFSSDSQEVPAVAMDADADFVVSWSSRYQDGDGTGIFAQRYVGAERIEGDFDGDGNADLLWHNATTGAAIVWLMEGATKLAAQSIGRPPVEWRVAGVGEFNGDAKADILWRNMATGATVVWRMDGFALVEAAGVGRVPPVWEIEQLGDTDGDGLSDIFWRNGDTGATVVWLMRGFTRVAMGGTGVVPLVWEPH